MKKILAILSVLLLTLICHVSLSQIGYVGFSPLEDGAVPVYIQDQTSEIIDLHVTRLIDDIEITANTSIDDTVVSISCDTTPVVGNTVCFKELTAFYQGGIIGVTPTGGTGYDLTLDTPLDFAFTTDGGCSLRDEKLNVNGAVTPVTFFVSPSGLVDPRNNSIPQKWDITRFMLQINDDAAMDDGKFGGLAALTNGIIVRLKNGRTKNIFNAKKNGDFALHAYDAQYVDSTLGPSGQYGLRVRRTFSGQEKNGVALRIDGATDDEFQIIVKDDLSGLTSFTAVAQGHVFVGNPGTREEDMTTISIPSRQWTLVADEILTANIALQDTFFYSPRVYYYYVNSGGAAPILEPGQSGNMAIPMESQELIVNEASAVDVYMWSPESTSVFIDVI